MSKNFILSNSSLNMAQIQRSEKESSSENHSKNQVYLSEISSTYIQVSSELVSVSWRSGRRRSGRR